MLEFLQTAISFWVLISFWHMFFFQIYSFLWNGGSFSSKTKLNISLRASVNIIVLILLSLLTLIWLSGGGGFYLPPPPAPVGFQLITQTETIKAVTLVFCSIQKHFIRNIRIKFAIPNSSQSPDIGQNSDGVISNFRISGQSLIKENFHNSRTSNYIKMKLE